MDGGKYPNAKIGQSPQEHKSPNLRNGSVRVWSKTCLFRGHSYSTHEKLQVLPTEGQHCYVCRGLISDWYYWPICCTKLLIGHGRQYQLRIQLVINFSRPPRYDTHYHLTSRQSRVTDVTVLTFRGKQLHHSIQIFALKLRNIILFRKRSDVLSTYL